MRRTLTILWIFAAFSGAAIAQPARAPNLAAFRAMDGGLWELRTRGSRAPERRLCLADPIALVQIRHGGAACSRYVLDDQPTTATVHYTCPGAGHGHTVLKVETRALIQLRSQGVAAGAPFSLDYEGRRRGAC